MLPNSGKARYLRRKGTYLQPDTMFFLPLPLQNTLDRLDEVFGDSSGHSFPLTTLCLLNQTIDIITHTGIGNENLLKHIRVSLMSQIYPRNGVWVVA